MKSRRSAIDVEAPLGVATMWPEQRFNWVNAMDGQLFFVVSQAVDQRSSGARKVRLANGEEGSTPVGGELGVRLSNKMWVREKLARLDDTRALVRQGMGSAADLHPDFESKTLKSESIGWRVRRMHAGEASESSGAVSSSDDCDRVIAGPGIAVIRSLEDTGEISRE